MSAAAKPLPVEDRKLAVLPAGECSEFCAEFELLLWCCGNVSAAMRASSIAQLQNSGVDWKHYLQIAEHHNVFPQVYAALGGVDGLAADLKVELHRRYEIHLRKSWWFAAELGRVLDHLQARGIRALAYKGPALAQVLYGDVARREFSDLDILVRSAEIAGARAALAELGYLPNHALRNSQERHSIATGYECSFDGPGGPHSLEMQWRILPRFYAVDFDMEKVFQRAMRVEVAGKQVGSVSRQDLFLILCVHAAKHGWSRLGWLCDIATLAGAALDWDEIRQDAERLGVARIVGVSLGLARELLGSGIQSDLADDEQVGVLAGDIERLIGASSDYDTETVSYFRLMMRLRERWLDRARFFWRLVLTPSVGDLRAVELPGFLFPLYRVVRLWRLSRRLVGLS